MVLKDDMADIALNIQAGKSTIMKLFRAATLPGNWSSS
jgi:hypothetical protein